MRIKFFLALVLVCSISVQAQVRTTKRTTNISSPEIKQAVANTLPIKRVIVYSNGVAYIERRGFV